MNILDLLIDEHKKVMDVMSKLKNTHNENDRTKEFNILEKELLPHVKGEEKALYPALKQKAELKELTLEVIEEHHIVKILLNELTKLPLTDEKWMAKFTVLKENVEHHIQEEENQIFVKAKKLFDNKKLEELKEEYINVKSTLKV